jgi:ATP-dependent exoDNAse (exonuclease V) beta subunit
VQIMTIHKAKGLEFDRVIVPGLQRAPRGADAPLLRWLEREDALGGRDLMLAATRPAGSVESPVYDCIAFFEGRKQHFEDGRLLYVAVTRARDSLHLIGNVRTRDKDGEVTVAVPRSSSFLRLLWPRIALLFDPAASRPVDSRQAAGQRTLWRLPADWRLPAPVDGSIVSSGTLRTPAPVTAPEFDWAGATIRHVGSTVHLYLQRMAEQGLDGWDRSVLSRCAPAIRRNLAQLGADPAELDSAEGKVSEALANVLGDDRAHWLLAAHQNARNEYGLSGMVGGELFSGRIDRTFVDENGVRWIVDYKSGAHTGGNIDAFLDAEQARYRPQLERYGALLSELERRPTRLALYFPLLKGWREWEYRGAAVAG